MPVKIKLKRLGKIRNPQYRIVVADSRNKRDGRSIEEIGIYQPKLDPSLIRIDSDRALYWLGVGAQPTDAVLVLLKITGDWQKHKGLPGTEGTLRVAAPPVDRMAIYEDAAKAAIAEAAVPRKKLAPKPVAEAAPVADTAAATPTADAADTSALDKAGTSAADAAPEVTPEATPEATPGATAEPVAADAPAAPADAAKTEPAQTEPAQTEPSAPTEA